jgi:hypothetical protein
MPRSFQEIIRLVQNGDPVDSSLNTILRALAGNAEYLKLLLDESLLGQAVMAREVTVHEDVKVGQPLYFNSNTQQLEQALAAATVDDETGELSTSDSTQVWGVCYYKHNSTKADILLYGYATVDVTESISDTAAGMYYLSATSPGKLVRQVPPVTVPVLYWDGDSKIYVNPNFNNAFLTHQHYKFELQAIPAGTNMLVPEGSPHIITAEDDTVEGWLPASSFTGAPAGAKFGYNIAVSALNNVWPPLPLNGATISWTRTVTPASSANVEVPEVNIAYFSQAISTTVTADSTDTIVLDLSLNSAGFTTSTDLVISFNQDLITDTGLVIDGVTVSNNDEISIAVTNLTEADIDINGTINVSVYSTAPRTVIVGGDFKEDTVPVELVRLDTNGIWWMSDCYGMVPWPARYGESTETTLEAAILTATAFGVSRRDGSDVYATAYGSDALDVMDVAVDDVNSDVYFTRSSGDICVTNAGTVDSAPEVIFTATAPLGIDIDIDNEHIYYTDSTDLSIQRVDLDGGNNTTLLSGLSSAGGIRLDLTNDHIYFVDGAKIRRCDLDGANPTDIITGLNTPRFLALDVSGDTLYWTDSGSNKITSSTLAGASITDLVTGIDAVGIDINLTDSFIYFTTESDTSLWRCTILGASVTQLTNFESWDTPGGVRYALLQPVADVSCPSVDMSLTCWFTKMQFQSASTVVTSLRAVEDSGLTVTCVQDGSTATTGDLQIDFDPDFLFDTEDDEPGHLVFKRHADKTFYRGPVVEAIVVDSDYIIASATAEDGDNLQGTVTLSFTPTPVGTELPIEMVRLNNVEEEFYEEVLGLGFRQDVDSEFRAKVNIPSTIEATTVRIRLRFVMLARAAGDLPAFTLTARNVTRPGSTTATSLTLPTADSAVTLSVADGAGMSEDDYIEVVSAEIITAPGDFVLFTLGRAGTADSFAGDVHVIDQRAVVSSVTA